MSKIEWPSRKEMIETIGYLACPGVVGRIEAMVPEDKVEKFKKKYYGRYSSEYPYVVKTGSKYGVQLRLYLNDNDGCSEFLKAQLDATYGTRLNDTSFIAHIVQTYDFMITNAPQDSNRIKEKACFLSEEEYEWFLKGFYSHEEFIDSLKKEINSENLLSPVIADIPRTKVSKGKKKAPKSIGASTNSYTQEQLQNIGWLGEKYVYLLLQNKDERLLDALHILGAEYSTKWFNEGFESDKDWQDKSIGEGCDLVIYTGEKSLHLEVKTSKKISDIFTMTNFEMVTMEKEGINYYIIKVNWIERLIKAEAPEIMVYENPFDRLFKPIQMKETTFYVRSIEDE